jgi:miniconductance mechanosensitive channel
MTEDYIGKFFVDWLSNYGFSEQWAESLRSFLLILILLTFGYIANFFTRKIIIKGVHFFFSISKNHYDDIFIKRKSFDLLSHFVPAIIFYYGVLLIFRADFSYFFPAERLILLIRNIIYVYLIFNIIWVVFRLLDSLYEIYSSLPMAKNVSLKGLVQVFKILAFIIGAILVIAVVFDKRPFSILTGLGAVTAVLMLIFKDTILGFVASIQLQVYNLLKPGDWIVVPSENADGNVIEISLAAVKVQNGDKTITMIPTYLLASKSFVNWRGLEQAGARRIKKSIYIDMKTVRLLTEDEKIRLMKFSILRNYLQNKESEIQEYNQRLSLDNIDEINERNLTNLGTFRKYVEAYLHNHPLVNKQFSIVVRYLQSGPQGMPLEIYLYNTENNWLNMEELQSNILEHILAVISEFGLSIFQLASANDFKHLAENKK